VKGLRAVVAISPPAAACWLRGRGRHANDQRAAPADSRRQGSDSGLRERRACHVRHDERCGPVLLTFKNGGHAMGLNSAPDSMRQKLWDQDWFEDPVWRKERINAINAHFITAFLDRYLKNDESRAATSMWPSRNRMPACGRRMRRPSPTMPTAGYAGNHGVEGFPAQSCGRFGIAASESGLGPLTSLPLPAPHRGDRLFLEPSRAIERRPAGRDRAPPPARRGCADRAPRKIGILRKLRPPRRGQRHADDDGLDFQDLFHDQADYFRGGDDAVGRGPLPARDPIARYLPEFSDPPSRSRGHGIERVPAERAITIQDLLRHTRTYLRVPRSRSVQKMYMAAKVYRRSQTSADQWPLSAPCP